MNNTNYCVVLNGTVEELTINGEDIYDNDYILGIYTDLEKLKKDSYKVFDNEKFDKIKFMVVKMDNLIMGCDDIILNTDVYETKDRENIEHIIENLIKKSIKGE